MGKPTAFTSKGRLELLKFIGAFESTYMPHHDIDVLETTGHVERFEHDLALLRSCGVSTLRYPVRWHRIEQQKGHYDWSDTDAVLGHLHDGGLEPIVDLLHHTSYPNWLQHGFADPDFRTFYLRFVEAFAKRYPWIPHYTLFNEPFSTLFLSGHEGIWPPYHRGLKSFVSMLSNVLPAVAEASKICEALLPSARHVWVDTCERHSGTGEVGEAYARYANDRRFIALDSYLGRVEHGDEHPFVEDVLRAGGDALMDLHGHDIDVLGLDYYAHCQWLFTDAKGIAPSPRPDPLADLIVEYANRYEKPCMLSETNIRGFSSDRATWLKYTLEQCESALRRGVQLEGYCWFPFVDSCDWDSLLSRCDGNIDPVGVFWLCDERRRNPSSMSLSFELAARGAPSAALPAYELQPPVNGWLQGWLPQMAHWQWLPAPRHESPPGLRPGDDVYEPLRVRRAS